MTIIQRLSGLEILDSRGRPTVQATCELTSGVRATVSVPSGASTGAAEALELRDGEPGRYRGLGCRRAVANIAGPIQRALDGRDFEDQSSLDAALLALDGTPNKAHLGANAILAVSLAFARACAADAGVPLWRHFGSILGHREPTHLPRPTINLFSGGKHAGGQIPVQDILVVASSAASIDEALAMTYAVYQAAADRCRSRYGMRALVADEGGLAPDFPNVEAALEDAVAAIDDAGFTVGRDVALCVDVASSHFFEAGAYHVDGHALSSAQMIHLLALWVERYPIVSLEDGLAEDDWANWPFLLERLADKALVLGDDLLATNPARIRRAIAEECANALLLKVNQIGTLTEAATACRLAREAGWAVTISARSGETEDDWLADLAVGWGGDQLKVGSITRSERLAKWNRLLAIEAETGLPLNPWPNR